MDQNLYTSNNRLLYQPFHSDITKDFWLEFCKYLVETVKLEEYDISCTGSYTTMDVWHGSRSDQLGKPKMKLDSQPFHKDTLSTSASFTTSQNFDISNLSLDEHQIENSERRFCSPCVIKYCKTETALKKFKIQAWLTSLTKEKICLPPNQ